MIIDWEEIADERAGTLDQIKAIRHYVRSFRIITNSTLDGPATILTNSLFLGLLQMYVEANGAVDPGAILRTTRVAQPEKDNPYVWILTYEYSSEPLDVQQRDGSGQGLQDPLIRPPIFTIETSKFQRIVNVDALGAAVTNSAGAPFSPLPEADDTRLILRMERNESEPDWNLILTYQDAVNSDIFLGFDPGVAKANISAQSMYENNTYYWKVTYVWEFRNYVNIQGTQYSAWDLHLLDQGYYSLDSKGAPRLFTDNSGNPVNEPVLLDGKGSSAIGGVTSIEVLSSGAGYSGVVPLVFTGGNGTGAEGFGICPAGGVEGGPITSAIITNPGAGYTSAPTVTTSGPGGGAAFQASFGQRPVFRHFRPYNWLPFEVFDLPETIN